MKVIASADFLREFTIYAEQTAETDEVFVVQRSNGKNLVLMSLDKYNEYNKKLFLLKNRDDADGTEESTE